MGGRVRMTDVARRAHVAPATVSRVLRQPEIVAAATRNRVLRAIDELNYVPNRAAGSLASQRTGIVAMIVPTLANSIFAETVQGTATVLRACGHELLLGNSGYDDLEEESLVRALLGRQPEAFILTGARHTPATRAMLTAAAIPVVETWELPASPIDAAVGFDNAAAARAMVEYLIDRGHRRIAMIARPFAGGTRNDQRIREYLEVVRERGLADGLLEQSHEANALRGGARAMSALLTSGRAIDAVFCADDVHALGALFECRRRGIRIPEDLALAGFGDFDVAGEAAPSLTTVRVPGLDIGRCAAERILARLAGTDATGGVEDVGFALVPRESA